jgi:hypothetical protein
LQGFDATELDMNVPAMPQLIEAPNERDIERLARQLIHASELVEQATRKALTGAPTDLALIQQALDAKVIEPEATYSLQALGIAFGKVFIENNEFYDWWMVEDEYGRDPAIRYKETTLLAFAQTMISKRVERGDPVSVVEMYGGLSDHLEKIRAENYSDE